MSIPCNLPSDLFKAIYSFAGNKPIFHPTCNDYNPAVLPGFVKSYEEYCMDTYEYPGRNMALHLLSPGPDGILNWETESDEYIAEFKEISNTVGYSLNPIPMYVCNSATQSLDLVAIPPNYPVTFRVNKRVGNENVFVKYLQYTTNGNLCYYTKV